MANRTSIIIEDGVKRLRTENDTMSIGFKSFDDNREYASLVVTGSANGSVNGTYTKDAAYNGANTYVNGGLTIFYTGKIWALNASTTDNYWDCMYTCGSQVGIYKEVDGGEELKVLGSTEDLGVGDVSGTLTTSNGIFATTYLTTDVLTINQARFYFSNNANKLDLIESNNVAFVTETDNVATFGLPTGNRDDWAVQTFQSVLIGSNTTDVSSTNFDDTFIPCLTTNADLGCTEWIYTSNFRTDGNHYTDNLTDDTSLEIAGIEHNAALGVKINTPDTRPHWGENGQAVFTRDTRRFSIKYGAPTLNYPEFPDWRELGDMYDEYMDAMDYYKRYYVLNRTTTINVETVNLTTNINNGGVSYSILSSLRLSDGSCYFPSFDGDASLHVDASETPNTVNGDTLRQYDVALSPLDGKIYLAPTSSNAIQSQEVGVWTPETPGNVPSANWASYLYIGAVASDDGTIHFVPGSAGGNAVKFDPVTGNVSLYGYIASSNGSSRAFISQINHRGDLYCLPARTADTGDKFRIRKVDVSAETITDIDLYTSTQSSYSSTGFPYKDNVYFAKKISAGVFQLWYFNTTNNSNGSVNSTSIGNLEFGGSSVLAPDGCAYFSNWDREIVRVDLTTNVVEIIATGVGATNLSLDTNGYLIAVEAAAVGAADPISSFKKIKIFDVEIDPNFLCNRYLNTT